MSQIIKGFKSDVFITSEGELEIFFIGHGTLAFRLNDLFIHVDPVCSEGDYSDMPKADVILVTHEHPDHLDTKAIELLLKENTIVITNPSSAAKVPDAAVLSNGDSIDAVGIHIEAVPAYNQSFGRTVFHPRHRDNGYILTIGDKRVFVAGDTEDIPEMSTLKDIDIAFLPVNQPYTMTVQQAARAANAFKPGILYPYHYGKTHVAKIQDTLSDQIELRIRELQ